MLDYGIIGNCKTCALVKKDSSIDWFCFPKFNSPSVFGKILDKEKGGHFKIIPKKKHAIRQEYVKDTNILKTTFYSKYSEFEVYDFFPRYRKIIKGKKLYHQNKIVRIVKKVRGDPDIKVEYGPRLNYAKGNNSHEIVEDNLIFKNKDREISLISNIDYKDILSSRYFKIEHTRYMIVGVPDNASDYNVKHCLNLMNSTKKYWQAWVDSLILPTENREYIIRSALLLKLMVFSKSGAIIAAPTTSIPEEIGSDRTFDYRFCWIRDASLTVDALKKIGRDYEAKKLMEFIFQNTVKEKKRMQIMYGIEGETRLTEKELGHLAGYGDSKPVRIGNAAYNQKQNDIYGSLIDVIYLYYIYYQYEKKMPLKYWQFVKYLVHEIESNWQTEDHGIWEFRSEKKHFVYSKLMCYVGISRALRIARHLDKKKFIKKWNILKEKIKLDIIENGWNDKLKSFTIYYGSSSLDAANLMMSYHEFLDYNDHMLTSTINATHEKLCEDYLVQRYTIKDDFGKSHSSFTICSFWLVDALYSSGKKREAKKIFRKLMKNSNHLGLFSEDIDTKTKELLGNFPQAYTHIAVINSSILLSEWDEKRIKLDFDSKRKRIK